jgi:PAS domain S-box-containing protein
MEINFDDKFYKDVLNALADPIFVKDKNHNWILLNDAFCKFMGKGREELIGKSDYDFFPKNEADVFWNKDEEVFNSEKENINEENFTDSTGKTHVIMTKKTIYRDKNNEKILVGIISDITERKLVENNLIMKNKELERTNRLMIDRELKMIELKKKYKELENKKSEINENSK